MAKKQKPEKISEEQLKEIQKLVSSINKAQFDMGALEVQKHQILHYIAGIEDEMKIMQSKLQEEYGTDSVDVTTGVINYELNGEVNKKN